MTPASLFWDGGGLDGLWHNPLNWTTDTLPGPEDNANIGMGYNLVASADVSVGALSCSSPITFNGSLSLGSIIMSYISAYATFNGDVYLEDTLNLGDLMGGGGSFNADVHIAAGKQLQLSSGIFSFGNGVDVDGDGLVKVYGATASIGSGSVSFRNLELTNTMSKLIGAGGTATIKNQMNFLGGMIDGSGSLMVESGALNIAGAPDKQILGWAVENRALTNWTGGNIVTTSTTFTNRLGGNFELSDPAGNWTATGGSFVNEGTFSSSGLQHTMGIEFTSTNQAEVVSGNLRLTQGREFGGRVTIEANSSITLSSGVFQFNSDLDILGTGTLVQEGGIVQILGIARCSPVYELRGGALEGGGTFYITNRMTWIEGEMRGTGTTRIDQGAQLVTNIALGNSLVLPINGRTLNNYGSFSNTGNLEIVLGDDARILNYGTMTLNVPQGTSLCSIASSEDATANRFENYGVVTRTGPGERFDISAISVVNDGEIRANSRHWEFATVDLVSRGFIEAAEGATVIFRAGENRLEPTNPGESALRGAGTFVLEEDAQLIVPGLFYAVADNLQILSADAKVTGSGRLRTRNLVWSAGTMEGNGVTELLEGDRMVVQGDVTLDTRTIDSHGTIEWQYNSLRFDAIGGSKILVFGLFDIYSIGELGNAIAGSATLTVCSGGTLRKLMTEGPETTTIRLLIQNQGTVDFESNVTVTSSFVTSGENVQTLLGAGVYNFQSVFAVTNRSRLRLGGGEIITPLQLQGHTDGRLEMAGTYSSSLPIDGTNPIDPNLRPQLDLTGNLTVASRTDLEGADVRLHGHQMTVNGDVYGDANTRIHLQGGTLQSILSRVQGRIFGPGRHNGRLIMGAGAQLNPGEGGAMGVLTIEGDLELEAGSVCHFQIGANGHDRVNVSGHAMLAGELEVTLIAGFVPELGQPFDIINFGTSEGAFDNDEVVIGDIVLTIDYSYPNKVRLIRTA